MLMDIQRIAGELLTAVQISSCLRLLYFSEAPLNLGEKKLIWLVRERSPHHSSISIYHPVFFSAIHSYYYYVCFTLLAFFFLSKLEKKECRSDGGVLLAATCATTGHMYTFFYYIPSMVFFVVVMLLPCSS